MNADVFPVQSSVKMKLLCVQVIKDLLDEGIDVRQHWTHMFDVYYLDTILKLYYLFIV